MKTFSNIFTQNVIRVKIIYSILLSKYFCIPIIPRFPGFNYVIIPIIPRFPDFNYVISPVFLQFWIPVSRICKEVSKTPKYLNRVERSRYQKRRVVRTLENLENLENIWDFFISSPNIFLCFPKSVYPKVFGMAIRDVLAPPKSKNFWGLRPRPPITNKFQNILQPWWRFLDISEVKKIKIFSNHGRDFDCIFGHFKVEISKFSPTWRFWVHF